MLTCWRLTDSFQRASFLSIDRDSCWDLAMSVFAREFASNECSPDMETTTLILLSVSQLQLGIKGGQLSVHGDDPIILNASACSMVVFGGWR